MVEDILKKDGLSFALLRKVVLSNQTGREPGSGNQLSG